ncbi:glycoside hydrolase family 32 protein [Maribacter sp. 2210JD10-5]|uniref:glycoside hydrolase family 32 protein n=1 Tax=Maribacter sp. 2210JD10-5 TaxID=3386272 RepID=UPI0039BD1206
MKQSSLTRVFVFTSLIFIFILGCADSHKEKAATTTVSQRGYQEKHRPQLHFSPKANWMNDPNGMFYYNNKYHLFYQYYPDSTVWGPMHWGHAESEDLVHWKELPIALYPDSLGCIFSGGAVVDLKNTSKLGTAENPPIVATFTHHDFEGEKNKTNDFQKQSLAYSLDGGYEWTKYKGNPIIPNTEKIKDFRDPKVVWHEPSQKWILTLAAYDRVKFYASPNLKDWEFLSDFGIEGDNRLWECPDLFPIKVAGTAEEKWVLLVSIQKEAPNGGTATSYFIGDFDGTMFKSDVKQQKWLDWGTDNYAFVTWNNVPKEDDRVLGIGWMSNWRYAQIVPTTEWRSAMTVPRELRLTKSASQYVLQSEPVKELETLRGALITFDEMRFAEEKILEGSFSASQTEMEITFDVAETTANSFGIQFQNKLDEHLSVTFDKQQQKMFVDRTHSSKEKFSDAFFKNIHEAPVDLNQQKIKVRLLLDASSIEIFIGDGAVSFTSIFFPSEKFTTISLLTDGGNCTVNDIKIYDLKGIWE